MRLFLCSVFTFISACFFSQDTTAMLLPKDTIKVHSPKKAIIFSAVIPGSGQIYNHIAMPKGKKNAFWKVPLIYAGLGATGYFLINNQQAQRSLRTEYDNRQNGGAIDPKWSEYDDDAVLTLYGKHLDRRDLSIIGFGLVYLLQLADAGIEAHFVNFDISEDLSLAIEPAFLGKNTIGMSLTFNFR